MRNVVHHASRQPEAAENHAHGSHYNPQNDGVDDGGDHPDPESSVANSHHRRYSRLIANRWGSVGRSWVGRRRVS